MSRLAPHPPSGMAPPAHARLAGGRVADLHVLASQVADRHLGEHSDELERYGPVARDWCVHDNQHLINWAILDARGDTSLPEKVVWLARVLDARDYPLSRLRDNLLTAAAVLRESGEPDLADPADRLDQAVGLVRLDP